MAFVVVATWTAKENQVQRVEELLRTMTPLSRAEEGNLFYQAQVSPAEPRTFLLYQQYVDEAAYEAHKATPHFQEHVLGNILDYLEKRSVKTYLTVG